MLSSEKTLIAFEAAQLARKLLPLQAERTEAVAKLSDIWNENPTGENGKLWSDSIDNSNDVNSLIHYLLRLVDSLDD